MPPVSTKELKLYEKKEPSSENEVVMPISVHLEELRNKILISLSALLITTILGFFISREIIKVLIDTAPLGTTFLQIKPGEFFFCSMRVALYFGIALASPVIIWQLGGFILPGLKLSEKKIIIPILSGAPVLFCIGSMFAYYFVIPSMLNFLFGFGKNVIPTSISIESFISFSLLIMAVCGCTFLLPVIIFALASVGILNSEILINNWRYAILGSLILGAVLTPTPDPFNMMIVSGILIALYFLSFGILKLTGK